ncbi:polysaccharide deacetylase family protein [Hoeflea sp. G2-23]|uniref:Chitooligosaccharide deacetylase n=1 Tax=Hoeflea algicola TaxID=2983763 RepID=A0ABT3Z9W6_9HYPH|nr:polysaccharide deacetylase family protein [Hoeflea algicola]MCY0148590.1 polysaccharide deacetylase family protein [Hoeflea algicola]
MVQADFDRDYLGYRGNPPSISWPGNAPLAVSFVVNFEESAEYSIRSGDQKNEAVHEVNKLVEGADTCVDRHFEYGTRSGWWRLMDCLDRHHVKATVSTCGMAAQKLPELVADAVARGHEISAHGWRWESHAGMAAEEERGNIRKTVDAITEAAGRRPVGWHTRSSTSLNTRRLLVEDGGFLYDSDAYNDDVPYFTRVGDHRHLVLPYAFDTNDMQFYDSNRFNGRDFAAYVIDAFDWLVREGRTQPRMLSIGLHLRIIGRPGRMAALEQILEHITDSQKAWVTTREEIARHWIAETDGSAR